jgi:hypothetical protein
MNQRLVIKTPNKKQENAAVKLKITSFLAKSDQNRDKMCLRYVRNYTFGTISFYLI